MGRYRAIYKDGELFAEYANGELVYLSPKYQEAQRSELPMPMVIRDIGEYSSPIDGERITSRSQHRDHMRAHGVTEVGNEPIGNMKPPEPGREDRRQRAEAIKRRIEEVKSLDQGAYDTHVKVQQAEHAAIAAQATP